MAIIPTSFLYGDPLEQGDGLTGLAQRASQLGFRALIVPPPFRAGPLGDRFLPAALGDAGDAGPVAGVAEACRAHGVAAFIDLVLDQVAAGSELSRQGPFTDPSADAALDPRSRAGRGAAVADAGTDEGADALGCWWGGHVQRWQDQGLAGVRLLGLDRLPQPGRVVRALRAAAPGAVLIGWTPGMHSPALHALKGAGLDLVTSSLPWWDWRADWLWDEYALLRRVAPVLMAPEAPFGPRLAADGASAARQAALLRRGAGLAAVCPGPWLLVAGAEHGATDPLDTTLLAAAQPDGAANGSLIAGAFDLSAEVAALNAAKGEQLDGQPAETILPLSPPGADVLALLVSSVPDPRRSADARLLLVNTGTDRAGSASPSALLTATRGSFGPFQAAAEGAQSFGAAPTLTLRPGESRSYTATALAEPERTPLDASTAVDAAAVSRVCIENPSPCVDGGEFAAKRTLGELLSIEADILTDGHDKLAAAMQWQAPGAETWQELPMAPIGNDRWAALLPLEALGTYRYDIVAWRDVFATYRDELQKKHKAGLPLVLELQEGRVLLEAAAGRNRGEVSESLTRLLREFDAAEADARRDMLLADDLVGLMRRADHRPHLARLPQPALVECERTGAGFASWYEVFPRSMSDDPTRHGTFADVQRHLPRVAAMGFDVLYFPPFHPIGRTNRKGKNNSLRAEPGDCGSPYAIGAAEGGHDALHPELGTIEDFQHLREDAARHGLELAMDFAIQCSPDHPWLKEHPDWFQWRPDGTMRFAENPPKKYEDIVNVDFYAKGAVPGLWTALCEAVLFWAGQGVRLFRVDNPHTKPLPFWHWMIREVKARFPDAVFLSEAFTRPKVMYRLAKVGFSQSYTYFTWRTKKWEFEQYLRELTQGTPREVFRPHFFVNTPDINPPYLHGAGRQVYLSRAALAATLSGLWGVYNGFELCEGTPVPGKEEYLDSEKYELRAWDWNRPGNIVPEITALNRIRRQNPALHSHLGVDFLEVQHEGILFYEKSNPDRSNVLLVAVSLQPDAVLEADGVLPFWKWNRTEGDGFVVEDLVAGTSGTWQGKWHRLRLTPERPYLILRVSPQR